MNGSVHAGIKKLIRGMNQAWMSGRFDDLQQYFAEDVVMVAPGGGMRMIGREAMIDSFRQYTEQATTHKFDETGLDVDVFARRMGFFCAAHIDLFEEVAKLRAMRRIWARLMRERYGAKEERSAWFRTAIQTSALPLTAQAGGVSTNAR